MLQKISDPRQKLLSDISTGKDIKEVKFSAYNLVNVLSTQNVISLVISSMHLLPLQAVDKFISINQNRVSGEIELVEGEWKMIWSSQVLQYPQNCDFSVT